MTTLCPCGSKTSYNSCCEPIISGKKPAATAEKLMRSRYTAFTQANVDYLMRSWHSETRNLEEKNEIAQWAKDVIWLKLEIEQVEAGLENDTQGTVTFKAYFEESKSIYKIHEKSIFYKENGLWVYHSGTHY